MISLRKFLLAAVLALAPSLAVAADNYLVQEPNGNFKVLDCTDTAGVCKFNVNATAVPAGTQDVNLKQVNGATTTAFNSGVVGAQTQRVVLATDVALPTPGSAAASLGKAEDAPHTSGDIGVAEWGVANEAQTAFAADGDYTPRSTDTKGNTYVKSIGTAGGGVSVSQTRPSNTNTYGAGDVLGPTGGGTASMNFANITPAAGEFMITSASLERDVAALVSGETSYILYLYNVTQPSAQADEATWDLVSGDRASYLGSINLGTPVDLGSTLYVETNGINKQVKLTSTSVFGVLVTVTGYVAASASVLTVTLHGFPIP